MRHRLELPQHLAGARVVGARITRDADRVLERGRADDHDVLEDRRRAAIRRINGHRTVGTEASGRLARLHIDRHQARASNYQQPRAKRPITRPIAESAGREPAAAATAARARVGPLGRLVDPQFLAGIGIKRDDAVGDREIHRSADDERGRGVEPLHRVRPLEGQLADVRFVDLVQRGEASRGKIAVDRAPVPGR